ncbi:M13-type metalloendopeptidase [Pseudomarimonas salicorniae]|uniref:M13 family metallopeptidase n=1 Tax=Pseudomarimonas salicorniae TaxID=2933270 RepID=A0ABT0GK96_9GAMM|nr:M13 family metallopeptidase [Lysobacter sp. CAU 1642]MCK7594980.1 M13 family metallopeptidase [Lysobacter sp. CAU 1642]
MAAIRLTLLLAATLASSQTDALEKLDPRDFATEVAACTDLYQFANGGWLKNTPVPADASRINRFSELKSAVRGQRIALLQAIMREPTDPLDTPIALLARSTLDENLLRAARDTTLAALLPALQGFEHRDQVPELLRAYQERGIPVLVRFSAGSKKDVLRITAQPLGLPDPAFYTRQDAPTREWLGRYRAYIESLLPLVGSTDPASDSAWVIDLESRVAAAATAPAPETLSLRDLERRFPLLDLRKLIRAKGLDGYRSIELAGADQLLAVERLVKELHPVQWRAWLRFRLAHLLAPYLDAPFREPYERFVRRGLHGSEPPATAEDRALEIVELWLGDAFAQRYIDTYFDAARQEAARTLFGELRESLALAIPAQTRWSEETRETALAKLKALELDLRIPGQRPDLASLTLDAGTLVGNVLAINRWQPRHGGGFLPGGQTDALRPQLGYLREQNRLLASPGLWQAPLFDPAAEPAVRYGGIGALLAHELAHGFDLGGASFNAKGAPVAWWEEAERAAWISATQPLVAQYSAYPGLGERPLDGARLLPENVADLAGLELAWAAFRRAQADLSVPAQHALTPAQRFFVTWASLWRENASEDARRAELLHAAQAPARYRAIGPLPHLPGFAEAFGCKPGQPMLQAPSRVQLWAATEDAAQ